MWKQFCVWQTLQNRLHRQLAISLRVHRGTVAPQFWSLFEFLESWEQGPGCYLRKTSTQVSPLSNSNVRCFKRSSDLESPDFGQEQAHPWFFVACLFELSKNSKTQTVEEAERVFIFVATESFLRPRRTLGHPLSKYSSACMDKGARRARPHRSWWSVHRVVDQLPTQFQIAMANSESCFFVRHISGVMRQTTL